MLIFSYLCWKLRVAKGQPMPSVASQSSVNKSSPLASDWNHSQESNAQQPTGSSNTIEKSVTEAGDEVGPLDDEG